MQRAFIELTDKKMYLTLEFDRTLKMQLPSYQMTPQRLANSTNHAFKNAQTTPFDPVNS